MNIHLLGVSLFLAQTLFAGNYLMAQKATWFKGNLHTHSLWSDGNDYPEMIMEWYKEQGYHFVALSDHNILAEGEKWIPADHDSLAKASFRRYLTRYGEDWVRYQRRDDTTWVKLKTLPAYRKLFEEDSRFLILKSEEISDEFDGKPLHLNATNLAEALMPQGGNSLVEVLQNNIDAVQEQRWLTGQPMLVHINHPNFHWAIRAEDLILLQGERFFEVFNGHPMVRNMGDEEHNSTEQIWDIVNTSYAQTGKPLLLGLATDDSHHYHRRSPDLSNAGRAWIQVRSRTLTAASLIDAMEAGDFYATTGVELLSVKNGKKKIKISIKAESGIRYRTQFIGSRGDQVGIVLAEVEDDKPVYKFKGNELFVRAKIISDKPMANPMKEARFESAWTQPIIVQKIVP